MNAVADARQTGDRVPDEVEQAIGWKVLIDSGEATEEDERALQAWLRRSSLHEAAWIDLMSSLSPFGAAKRVPSIAGSFTEAAMKRAVDRRKATFGIFGVIAIGLPAMAVLDRYVPLGDLTADRFTRTGETRKIALAGGSSVILGARSAVDLDDGAKELLVSLREGEVMIKHHRRDTPLSLRIGDLAMTARAGTFVARRQGGSTSIAAVEGDALVSCDRGPAVPLAAGRCIVQKGSTTFERAAEIHRETAWIEGLLVVEDHSLKSVVTALKPYFAGVLRLDPALDALRVTGVFPLTDPPAAMDMIARTLDLSVSHRTPFYISLAPKSVTI